MDFCILKGIIQVLCLGCCFSGLICKAFHAGGRLLCSVRSIFVQFYLVKGFTCFFRFFLRGFQVSFQFYDFTVINLRFYADFSVIICHALTSILPAA